jgi:hypothetical protein
VIIELEKEVADFIDILNLILPPIEIEEDIEIDIDKNALKSHGINFTEDEENYLETVKFKISKGIYEQDYYEGEFEGYGKVVEKDGIKKLHLGIDFSYGKDKPVCCMHPYVFSPITGNVEKISEENGEVTIRDFGHIKVINGKEINVFYYHTIRNLDEINPLLVIGQEIYGGSTVLGTLGGRGKHGRYTYLQHVHYEIKMIGKGYTGSYEYESNEKTIGSDKAYNEKWFYLNPENFWDYGHEFGISEFELVPDIVEKSDSIEKSEDDIG